MGSVMGGERGWTLLINIFFFPFYCLKFLVTYFNYFVIWCTKTYEHSIFRVFGPFIMIKHFCHLCLCLGFNFDVNIVASDLCFVCVSLVWFWSVCHFQPCWVHFRYVSYRWHVVRFYFFDIIRVFFFQCFSLSHWHLLL